MKIVMINEYNLKAVGGLNRITLVLDNICCLGIIASTASPLAEPWCTSHVFVVGL